MDGTQIGGVQSTTADVTQGQSQTFNVAGTFAPGPNTVSINYLNADNSLLEVQNATINGTAVPNSATVLSNNGAAGFGFDGPAANAPVAIGVGADTLALHVSERGQPAGAQFTIDVNGAQVGGVQTTVADSSLGQSEAINVLGNFPGGFYNKVTINYLNADNSLLNVDADTIDGDSLGGIALTLSNIGSAGFAFSSPGDSSSGLTTVGSGPDMLMLTASQRGQPAGALFTISVDGTQIGGVQATTADSLSGHVQQFDVAGSFASGQHTATISYLNASNSVLSVTGATIDGAAIPNGGVVLSNIGTESFTFITPPGYG